ncbi:winged helix-turn-helix domain-containing protein [Cupriavidus alkaliphilus]|uniref:5-methylcytosine-specific restriction protein A n=1 Tax=Cupriavidus alkaliphilus TaxID=942866 RepID=A0A7W4YNK0_9BURK|nr:winged helix-turn-helix domain-containing protein [Cupriavidus alkaliphilus]MBB3005805.1 5-methylcytosine-specific restriction protein A [Cupriavidus alkaliphilus]
MPYPAYPEIESALLRFIHDEGGEVNADEVYFPLGVKLGLSKADMERTLDEVQGYGGNRPKWENMVQWARNSLAKKHELRRPADGVARGVWKLTEKGSLRAVGMSPPQSIRAVSVYPDEVSGTVWEGAKRSVLVNVYERNAEGRQKCIDHYGYRCAVCSFDFAERYGQHGKNFIHVHHLTPMASVGKCYQLDPIKDLRPVCPNCHAMLHRTDPPCSIEELQSLMTKPIWCADATRERGGSDKTLAAD